MVNNSDNPFIDVTAVNSGELVPELSSGQSGGAGGALNLTTSLDVESNQLEKSSTAQPDSNHSNNLSNSLNNSGEKLAISSNKLEPISENRTSTIFTFQIKTSPENDLIYDPFGIANADDQELTASIRKSGICEPLVLTRDYFLLSGHRRLGAAKRLKLIKVPVRFVNVIFDNLTKSEKLFELRQFNQQRDKTPGEKIKEVMLDINPDLSYEMLLRHRAKQRSTGDANVNMGEVKRRPKITTTFFLNATLRIIEANQEYWPLTVRRIHYLLLNNPPPRHDSKFIFYQNDKSSYKALTELIVRARLSNLISMQSIEDTTRPIQLGGGFASFQQFIANESENFLLDYSRDLMQGQPHHIEIMLEKNALRSIIEQVARNYCIPVTTGRGYASLSPRHDLFSRFKRSGKKKLVLLMLTDFDPDGEQIAASFARSLRDDFGLKDIHAVKVALTAEDVEQNNLPSDLDAKPSSPNYKKFFAQYGSKAVELDAAPVELLQSKLQEAIEGVIDVTEFNSQIDMEKSDAQSVEAYRQTVFKAIGGPSHG